MIIPTNPSILWDGFDITQQRIIVYLCLAPFLNIFVNISAAEELE